MASNNTTPASPCPSWCREHVRDEDGHEYAHRRVIHEGGVTIALERVFVPQTGERPDTTVDFGGLVGVYGQWVPDFAAAMVEAARMIDTDYELAALREIAGVSR